VQGIAQMVSCKARLTMVMAAVASGDVEAERCMLNECEQDVNVGLSLLQHRAASMHKVNKYSDDLEDPDSEGDIRNWGYDDTGAWSQSFPDCTGIAQSPIDFGAETTGSRADEYPETLEATYEAVPSEGLKVVNTGNSIQVDGPFGELKLPDGLYKVIHLNFHCPSEHTVAGSSFPCEMHIVHQKEGSTGNADLAVVAIFFEEWSHLGSSEDAGIQLQFLRRLGFTGNLPKTGAELSIQSGLDIDLGVVFEKELIGHFWHYQGSLTTPPCSETVHWYVLQDAAAISSKMVATMKSLFPTNSRPVQPLGERKVLGDFEEINDAEFPQAHLPGVPMHWTYGEPRRWGKGYEDCKGDKQSPINLKDAAGTPAADATIFSAMKYEKLPGSGLKLQNNGHTVQVDGNFGTLSLPDGEYEAKQFHFHFPSEHEVKGVTTVGEMNIVHQKINSTGTDDLAVVAILFDYVGKLGFNKETGRELAFLRGLGFGKGLPKEEEESLISNSEIDLAGVFEHSLRGPYWHYQGSMTTPPCSETVHWYVMEERAALSPRMLRDFKDHFPDPMNSRPVQRLNGRTVAQSALSVGGSEW